MKLIKICIFFGLLSNLYSQNIRVLSHGTLRALPGVLISSEDKAIQAIYSDTEGYADVTLFGEDAILILELQGYQPFSISKSKLASYNNKIRLFPLQDKLSEIVISVTKWQTHPKEVANKIVSLSPEDIAISTPQTSADLLQSSGQVFVQKSQLGGGSPILRGFSTNRLLITVDGVRMNTAIFRGGNIQNIISIDPFTLDRSEILLGPGSVVYGSDAIGGVLNFYSKTPKIKNTNSGLSGKLLTRYASASMEKTAHLDLESSFRKLGLYSSISATDYGDLQMGSNGPATYLRPTFVSTATGVDTEVINSNPKIQRFTGYSQYHFLQKIRYLPSINWDFNLGLRYATTSDFPRYDRLLRRSAGQFRSADWYYGPQQWMLGNLNLHHKSLGLLYSQMKWTTAYQFFKESRNDRNFGSPILEQTKEHVDVYTTALDFEKKIGPHTTLFYGLSYVLNQVFSKGSQTDLDTRQTIPAPSRYPNGATWQSMAVYASVKQKLSNHFRFQAGLRYNRILLYAKFTDAFFQFPFSEANLDTDALTGSAGFNWLPNPILHWKLNFATAFRAPNIDDIGKIFDSEPGSVVVPNPDLRPEYAFSIELGTQLRPHTDFRIDLATYFTHLNQALVRDDFSLNGQRNLVFGGELSQVQAIQNAANTKVYGFEAALQYQITSQIALESHYTFVGGVDILKNNIRMPSRHVAPQFGKTLITYTINQLTARVSAQYQGRLRALDLAASERNKEFLYAKDKNGDPYAPSWYTLNLRLDYRFMKHYRAIFAIENLSDQRYRTYASGIAGPGRNFILSLQYAW